MFNEPSGGVTGPQHSGSMIHWVIITGEYPPQLGGVGDYTRLVAEGLERCSDSVQVWAPKVTPAPSTTPSARVYRLPDHFGLRGCAELSRGLARVPRRARLLVQYVPQAFGWRGMNVLFCIWLWRQRHRWSIDVMFHEVATPWGKGVGLVALRKNVLAVVTRLMARLVGHAAQRIFVSVPSWQQMLDSLPREKLERVKWLPVPSTMPTVVDQHIVSQLRRDLLGKTKAHWLLGHFGTFGGHIAAGLRQVLPLTLKQLPSVAAIMIGRGSTRFVKEITAMFPELRNRLLAIGGAEPQIVSQHLAACDCLVQPYADGISSRRTSAMAGLALGRPIVTTLGFLSEKTWQESKAVRLVDSFSEMPTGIAELLADPQQRAELGRSAALLYAQCFDIQHTIEALRSGC